MSSSTTSTRSWACCTVQAPGTSTCTRHEPRAPALAGLQAVEVDRRRCGAGRARRSRCATSVGRQRGVEQRRARRRRRAAQPVTRMLIATAIATSESSGSQPVIATRPTPTMTPTEVHTSVMRCLPSATRVAERCCRPTRMSSRPTAPLTAVATQGDGEADAQLSSGCGCEQPLDGGDDDERRRDEDHQALDAGARSTPPCRGRSGGCRRRARAAT